jgi:hypothetical protein
MVMNMKWMFSLCCALLLAGACSTDSDPRPVAEKFLKAMSDHNYKEARKYGTKETVKFLNQLERRDQLFGRAEDEKPGKIVVISEEIQGNRATVYFKEEGSELEQKISLRKLDTDTTDFDKTKRWKVALRKEEIKLNDNSGLDLPKDSVMKKIPS